MILVTAGAKMVPANYLNALRGEETAVVRPGDSWKIADFLLLTGGGDAHPGFYGQPLGGSCDIDKERDVLEFALFRAFADAGKPILGICRGMQLINVALGGTLIQHIENHSRVGGADILHPINGLRGFDEVNSAHHQAVGKLGAGLNIRARSGGIVEGISHDSLPIVGVQWHPERHEPTRELIFNSFLSGFGKTQPLWEARQC
ncbi:gamma-glutamyl-gamma-aminobutyrate hydrolase [Clostridia bacterium]|nr:gamma-glutamyl-gamma-aminobutyrate hydrolase [Clostridia bacterium]